MPRRLRPVGPNEQPERPAKLSVCEAAARGTHRQLLESLRDKIAKTIESANCHPRDLATLSYRLQVIAKELSFLDAGDIDEVGEVARTPDEAFDGSAV
jgi:hypothetical protein